MSDSPANGLDVADEILDRAVADQATRPSGSVEMAVTWYEADLTSVERVVTPPLVCRSLNDQRDCDALAGAHLEAYRTEAGQVDIYTEYGPYESNMWQMLVQTAQEVDLAERVVLAIADNPELAGIDVSPDVRVVVVGEAGVDTASIAASLATHEEIVTVPVVFGDAVPTPSDFPRDSVAARYYAGYLDTTGDTTCVGAIGVPWNQDESCVPVQPDTLTVTVASPSPTRTILIATLPLNTATAVALADGEPSRELTIIDASETGHKLSFAVLDGFIPRQLIVYDANDDVITRTDIISTGGAPLGYLPDNPGE